MYMFNEVLMLFIGYLNTFQDQLSKQLNLESQAMKENNVSFIV